MLENIAGKGLTVSSNETCHDLYNAEWKGGHSFHINRKSNLISTSFQVLETPMPII